MKVELPNTLLTRISQSDASGDSMQIHIGLKTLEIPPLLIMVQCKNALFPRCVRPSRALSCSYAHSQSSDTRTQSKAI